MPSTVHARDTENKAQTRAVASRMSWKSQSQKILVKGIQKTLEDCEGSSEGLTEPLNFFSC